jgi:hypothetical protein
MPATSARLHAVALLGYVSVAVIFAWPLPLQLDRALPGPPGGDTAVYAWNLWVFRHEILSHGTSPFFTSEILHATPPVALTLHNYTPAANLVALPLISLVGTLPAFNLLVVLAGALSAYAAFLLARQQVGDPAAAWIGGALFGFSPFMTARQMAHFSLVQAAALPLFALVLHRIARDGFSWSHAMALGAALALAYASDPYYAVYCALIGLFVAGWHVLDVERRGSPAPRGLRLAVNAIILLAAAAVLATLVAGGMHIEIGALRVSMRGLHTPVLVLTVLVACRAWIAWWPRISWQPAPLATFTRAGLVAALTAAGLLAPILAAMAAHAGDAQWIAPPVHWRSSPPGVDLLAFLAPNPVGTLTGGLASGWLASKPDGLYENVASIPWTAIVALAAAIGWAGLRLPRFWTAFTVAAAGLALGPFVTAGGVNTYVPTPWALLRYVPVVGAARMPTRLTILVMVGAAVLLAHAVAALRRRGPESRAPGRWIPVAAIGACLLIELCPAPRQLYPVQVPAFTVLLASDPRPVTVMHLPFGLRDGLSSAGDFSAYAQLLQTYHEKPLIGGYLSRLPQGEVARYREIALFDVLLDLSEGRPVSADRLDRARGTYTGPALSLGYVIVDTSRASPELVAFARDALDLQHLGTEGPLSLYIVR